MSSDGGLRPLFQKHLPEFYWQPVESWSTGRGVPDVNFCFAGTEGWIENKVAATNKVEMRPEQVAWHERRIRAGGRTFIAVRFKHSGGPRKGDPVDRLYLYPGIEARSLLTKGISHSLDLGQWNGGPARWDWVSIKKLLTVRT